MEFLDVLKNRHSCRSFDSNKKIEPDKLQYIFDCINMAPSAGNLKAYNIYKVINPVDKKLFSAFCSYQLFISDADVILVFCNDKLKNYEKYSQRGENLYCIQDATIAASYAQLAAAEIGLSSCWIGAFHESYIIKYLNLHTGEIPVVVLPVGYSK